MKIFSILLTLISATVFLYAVSTQVSISNGTHRFTGTLKTPSDEILVGIRLNFASDGKKLSTISDGEGKFSVDLLPGKYEITNDSSFLQDFRAFINIDENGINPSEVEFHIQPKVDKCEIAPNISCPKLVKSVLPPYPPAAKAVRASGEVIVSVKIDKDGKVLFAKAETGHALLRSASEKAARSCEFETSTNDGERDTKIIFGYLPFAKNDKLKYYSRLNHLDVFAWASQDLVLHIG